MTLDSFGIHWFRRDLRVVGNPALHANLEKHPGRVLGLFCFDQNILARKDFSVDRFQFFLNTLVELKKDLQKRGGDLLVLDQEPGTAFATLLQKLKMAPGTVSWNRDYEPFARARDQKIKVNLAGHGIQTIEERDHLFFEPHEVLKKDQTPYTVFTPYSKQWLKALASKEGRVRLEKSEKLQREKFEFKVEWKALLSKQIADTLDEFVISNQKKLGVPLPSAGAVAAGEALSNFEGKIDSYSQARDLLFERGTSKLSIYFKNGSLTTTQAISKLKLDTAPPESSPKKYLQELIWREFYYSILFHFPRIEKAAFKEKYKNIKWENDPKLFKSWCAGQTGFPVVDAALRELNETGLMHNRARMIAASFLVKDLLVDWRKGEAYFMSRLLDGDLAANNGGWQWCASTGCDAQPYFRIFNPTLQGLKFDPDAAYIKKWVPELRTLTAKEIHALNTDKEKLMRPKTYPKAIVNRRARKFQVLDLYQT